MKKLALAMAVTAVAGCSDDDSNSSGNDGKGSNNQAPVISDLQIQDVNGDKIRVNDVLKAQYTYTDSDKDEEGDSRFQWMVDGVTVVDATDSQYTVSETDEGKQITLSVVPVAKTGIKEGDAVVSQGVTVIVDGAPIANNVRVNDSNNGVIKAGVKLTGAYDYSDAEGDSEDTGATVLRWLRDGVEIPGANAATYTITSDDEGAVLIFEVTPFAQSGVLKGAAFQSAPVQVEANQAPVATNVTVIGHDGGVARADDQLTASYTYSDVENNAEGGSTFRWLRDGKAISGATDLSYTLTKQDEGKVIVFEVTPVALAGTLTGSPVLSQSVSVATQGAPNAKNVMVSDDNNGSIKPGVVLTGTYQYQDDDNDPEDLTEQGTQLRWLREGEEITGAKSNTYTVTSADEGKRLVFMVTPKAQSGEIEGTPSLSAVVQVAENEAPSVTNVTITDVNGDVARIGDQLNGEYEYSDSEGDAEGESTFRWLRDGIFVTGATDTSYTLTADDQGKSITFEVTPVATTGAEQGTPVQSNVLSVPANSAPTFTELVFNQITADVGDTLTIEYTYQDTDNDAQGEHIFRWYRDGELIAGAAGVSYTITGDDNGTSLTAKAIAVSQTGVLQGAEQDVSGALAIVIDSPNQAPTISNVRLVDQNGGQLRPGDIVSVTYDYSDVDGDEEGDTIIAWQQYGSSGGGGIPGAYDKPTYQVSAFYAGREITAVVTPKAKTGVIDGQFVYSDRLRVTQLPTVSGLTIVDENGGNVLVGDVLRASYTYDDAEDDAESGTTFRWINTTDNELIAGAIAQTYTVQASDAGKALAVHVSPRSDASENGGTFASPVVTVETVVLQEQTLQFNRDSDLKMLVAADFVNAASGEGTGAVSYSSSDNSRATVDASGRVTALIPGDVTITATIAADSVYATATQSYDLSIRTNSYPVVGWAGENDLDLRFQGSSPRGLTLYGTNDESCDLTDVHSCSNSSLRELPEQAAIGYRIIDTQGDLNTTRYYTAEYGDYRGRIQISPDDSTIQEGAAVIFFKGKLWAFGGRVANGGGTEIWTSLDGRSWRQQTGSTSLFTPRMDAQVVEFGGKLWMIGGYHNNWPAPQVQYADVWSSDDGINWNQVVETAPFGARDEHRLVVANDALWVMGGIQSDGNLWRSENGADWANMGEAPSENWRAAFAAIPGNQSGQDRLIVNDRGDIYLSDTNGVFQDDPTANVGSTDDNTELFVIDGVIYLVDTRRQTVRKSVDGLSWEDVTVNKPMPDMANATPLLFKHRMWFFAGVGQNEPVGVSAYSSANGEYWEIETDDAEFPERYNMLATSFGPYLIAAGGNIFGHDKSDVWRSLDGIDWFQLKTHELSQNNLFRNADMLEFNEKLWVASQDTLHVSDDGSQWQEVSYVNYPSFNVEYAFPQHNLMVYNNRLWLISVDKDDDDQLRQRVASSGDGVSWTVHTMTQPFTAIEDFQAVTFNNKLWVVGEGKSWSSSDGLNWQEHVPTNALPHLNEFDMVAHDGKLWVAGGLDSVNQFTDDVWSSEDGIEWTLVNGDPAFAPRADHQLVSYAGDLYIIGSRTSDDHIGNEVWKSSDGVKWLRAFQNKVEFDLVPFNQF